jgi:cell division protein FtsB
MATTQDFDDAFQQLTARQRTARRQAWLAVLLPATVGIAFLGYASWQLREAAHDVADLRTQVSQLDQQVAERTRTIVQLQAQIKDLEASLQQTTQLSRYVHPIDFVDLKMVYSKARHVAPVLGEILDLRERNVGWRIGGTTPEEGFDSPSFAAYILDRNGALPASKGGGSDGLLPRSRHLLEALPSVSSPQPGDLVFYPSGYALFWFVDHQDKPFVIGMTPSGIVALNPDFAEIVGVRRPKYQR